MTAARNTLVVVALVLLAGLAHCQCNDTTVNCPADKQCSSDDDCSGGVTCQDGCCTGAPQCSADSDCDQAAGECCLDGRCTTSGCQACENPCSRDGDCAELGVCLACVNRCCTSFACESDADCPPENDLPRYCADFDPELGCRRCDYVRCASDEDCQDPEFPLYTECSDPNYTPKCKQGQCVCSHPCGAPCTEPQYCCQVRQMCEDLPDPCPGVECPPCQQINPDPGGTLDEVNCVITGADCSCVPLPPLQPAFAGLHSAIALNRNGVPVLSGYYGQPYGDLIFGVADSDQPGATVTWEFVDGVPADAPCTGAADGPRGGIAEPGDDVGWDTDIVVDSAGRARISYFDRTHGALKYAAQQADGSWAVHTVDDQGITGRFSSMVLDAGGRPVIAYMTVKDGLTSYLKVARARNPAPSSDSDWIISVADAAAVPCEPDDCQAGEVCLADSGTCVVADDPANCGGGNGCPSGEVCVGGQCLAEGTASGVEDLPLGVGLFTQVGLFSDGSPVVAYYDSLRGNLNIVWWNPGAGDFDPPVILAGEDGSGNDTGNLGVDLSMAITWPDDTVHLAYQDGDLGDLYYLTFQGRQWDSAVVELVDAGARDANGDPTDISSAVGELHWVGNFVALAIDAGGVVRLAYQDGTSLDLVYALRTAAGVWEVEILARKLPGEDFDGAYGFFTDQVMNAAGDLAHISNFKHNLRTDPWSSQIDLRVR